MHCWSDPGTSLVLRNIVWKGLDRIRHKSKFWILNFSTVLTKNKFPGGKFLNLSTVYSHKILKIICLFYRNRSIVKEWSNISFSCRQEDISLGWWLCVKRKKVFIMTNHISLWDIFWLVYLWSSNMQTLTPWCNHKHAYKQKFLWIWDMTVLWLLMIRL